MEYPSTKRRKTSPTTRIDVDASKSQRSELNRHGNHESRSRASFMSPTKASLSRFHPNLLRRPGSAEPPKSSVASRRNSRKAQTEEREVDSVADKEKEKNSNYGLREAAQTNGQGHVNDNASSIYEETPSKLPPRTGAARGIGVNQERQSQLRTPTHDRKQQMTSGEDVDREDEPSLPSTPSQLGLEPPPEKPRGLLFQSPGRRRVHQNRNNAKSSPLKLNERAEPRVAISQDRVASVLGPRDSLKDIAHVGGVVQFAERINASGSRSKLARRMGIIQYDMTRLCIESPSRSGEKESTKRVARLKKQLTQDARAFSRLPSSDHLESRERPNTSFGPKSTFSRVSTESPSVFSRLVHLSPFSRRQDMPMAGLAPTLPGVSSEVETNALELGANITESELVTANSNVPHIRQSLDILIRGHEVFSKLQFIVDPVSQIVSNISIDQMVAWAAPDFTPWLSDETLQRTLQTIGIVLRRYLDLASLRMECWSRCRDTLPEIFIPNSTDKHHIEMVKAPLKLRVWWRLVIDDEGQVRSEVSLESEVPAQWRKLDPSSDLGRLSEAFDGLIRRHGVSKAIKIMSRFLFPP